MKGGREGRFPRPFGAERVALRKKAQAPCPLRPLGPGRQGRRLREFAARPWPPPFLFVRHTVPASASPAFLAFSDREKAYEGDWKSQKNTQRTQLSKTNSIFTNSHQRHIYVSTACSPTDLGGPAINSEAHFMWAFVFLEPICDIEASGAEACFPPCRQRQANTFSGRGHGKISSPPPYETTRFLPTMEELQSQEAGSKTPRPGPF